MDRTREYGNLDVAHLGLGRDFFAQFVIQDLFYLGETRSAEDLAVFTRMTSERLCLGCGLRTDEAFCSFFLQDRRGVFKATIRLLQLVLSDVPPPDLTDEERALKPALMPLVRNRDGHFLALFRHCCSPFLKAKLIVQSVGYLELAKQVLLLPL